MDIPTPLNAPAANLPLRRAICPHRLARLFAIPTSPSTPTCRFTKSTDHLTNRVVIREQGASREFFLNSGNFSWRLRVLSIESGSPNKTRLTGAQEKEGAHHGRRIDWISGRDSGDGSPPRRAVYLLSGAQAAQRRAARGHCPRSRHSDGAGIEPGGAFPSRGNPPGQRSHRLH